MDLTKIIESIKALVNDNTSTENVEKVGGIVKELEDAQKEYTDLASAQEELRKKYIDAIKDTSFKEKPKDDEPKAKTLEECVQEQIDNRK